MPNNFFGSKLNSVLLLVLIVLMVFALRIMLKNKETYLPFAEENTEINSPEMNTEQEPENINTWTGEPLGENQYISLQKDLNGDGKIEDISYEIAKTQNQNRLILNVNDVSYVQPPGDSNPANFFGVVDINTKDNMQEIALQDYGPSDDLNVTFLGWNGKEFVNYGNIPGDYSRMKFDGKGKVTTQARGQILETWFHDADYILLGGKLVFNPREFYEPSYYEPTEHTILQEFSFFKSPKDKTIIFTLEKGDRVTIMGCDDVSWCKVKNSAGVEGWFALENYNIIKGTNLSADDIFDELSHAD